MFFNYGTSILVFLFHWVGLISNTWAVVIVLSGYTCCDKTWWNRTCRVSYRSRSLNRLAACFFFWRKTYKTSPAVSFYSAPLPAKSRLVAVCFQAKHLLRNQMRLRGDANISHGYLLQNKQQLWKLSTIFFWHCAVQYFQSLHSVSFTFRH